MKFDDLDTRMRVFETAHDYCILPDINIVARLDGRNFTRLTKEIHTFEAPFDTRFRDLMIETVRHLMDCGFRILYGYTQSDEISLLFSTKENAFSRKMRKYNSLLASEASAKFSLLLGDMGCFDCRISQLPNIDLVFDYFRWRQEDAHRNALNAHCYWMLRKQGKSENAATDYLWKMSIRDKNEFLFQNGINFNDLPQWQKKGIGLYWENYEKQALNQQTGEEVTATRRRIKCDLEIPRKDEYCNLLKKIIELQ
jgi:tRNA(His) guanylyltransferase